MRIFDDLRGENLNCLLKTSCTISIIILIYFINHVEQNWDTFARSVDFNKTLPIAFLCLEEQELKRIIFRECQLDMLYICVSDLLWFSRSRSPLSGRRYRTFLCFTFIGNVNQ